MKITLFSVLVLILLTVAFLPNGLAQDFTRLNLPEGAKAILSKGRITDVAYSPDGTQVAVATYIGVWMHDPDTGEEIELLPGRFVQAISYSPDGSLLAVADGYGVELWDTVNSQHKMTLTGGGYSVAFSPDGQLIASGDGWADGTVYISDVASGQRKTTLEGHTDLVPSVSFSPDGQTLASASYDYTVRLWDVNTGRHKTTLKGHTYRVNSVSFSPDGRTLASASLRSEVRLWDPFTGQQKETLEYYGYSVTYSPDGSMLASDRQIWDATTGERITRLFGHAGRRAAFRQDGRMIAIGKQVWDVARGQPKTTFDGYGGSGVNVSFSPDGEVLATADGKIQLWDAETGLYRSTLTGGGGKSVAFSPNGQMIASSDGWLSTTKLRIWDVATEQLKLTFEGHTGEINSIAFSGDSRTIATASDDKTVRLWDITTGRLKATLLGHTEGVTSVAFSQDSQTLASTGYGYDGDYAIRVWDANTGDLKSTLTGHTYRITSLAFSPDGRTLASGSWDSTVRLWDVSTGRRKSSLSGFTCGIRSLAFSPDSSTLMIGNAQFNAQWLDVNTGEILETFRGHGSQVNSVAFSADGYTFASGGDGGVVFLWDLAPFIEYTPLNIGTQQPQTDAVIQPYEREIVRIIYFRPSDRLPRKGINAQLDSLIRWTQYFYAEQMQTYGERKTFAFETNDAGHARIHHIMGKFDDAYYHQDTYRKVVEEVAEQFDTSRHVYLIAVDVSSEFINNAGTCGIGGGGWNSFNNELWRRDFGGTAVIPASGVCINPSVTAHELGHVFGLEHDFRDDAYLMSYGTQQRLSHCAAEWLDTHRFFNNDPTFFSENTTIDILSSATAGQGSRRLQFQLNDADGLHQAQLIIPAAATDPAPGTKLHDCESLTDEHQTIEFTVPGLDASPGVEVTLQVIDARGNITKQTFPVLLENRVLNRAPTTVSTIPIQTLTTAGNATSLNMSLYFSDPDSDNLRYTAESDNTSVATVSVSGSQIVITPKGTGSAIVTVTASDGTLRVVQHLSVHVSGTPIATNATDTFDDLFEGTALQNSNWQWQNEPANWDVGETRENFLHIEAETNRNIWASDTTHFLYQETDADTFDVETHFFTRWDTTSGVNGLVVKSPADNNWVTIKFWSRDAAAKGQIQYQTRGRGLVADPAWRPEFGATELFLRLRKHGDTYTGWYKTRAADPWIEIGVTNFALTPPLHVGIYAGVAAGTGTLTVDYDYFRSTVDTGVLASPVLHGAAMEAPEETTLLPNYPNPFNPETWIPYQLASPSDVTVHIYAVNGHLVRRLPLGHRAAGVYHGRSRAAYWDGKNESGEPVASGIYFYTLVADDFTATRKMLIRK